VKLAPAIVVGVLLVACPLWAAMAGADGFNPEKARLEEVYVYAEKREATIESTALSVTAINGDMLQEGQGFSFSDLSRLTTGVFTAGNNVGADIKIRGVGTEAQTTAISAVAIFIDGALQPFPGTAFAPLYDVAQIEVLRGPQGTLFGRASPAGTINIRHRRPSLTEPELSLDAVAGSDDTYNLQLAAGTPVGDSLGVRVAGLYDRRDPTGVENPSTGTEAGSESRGLRGTLVYDPPGSLRTTFISSWLDQDADTPKALGTSSQQIFDRHAEENVDTGFSQEIVSHVLELEWQIGRHTLASTTTYQDAQLPALEDLDATGLDDEQQSSLVEIDTITQELRVSNSEAELWHYIAGLYYSNSDGETVLQRRLGSDNTQAQAVGALVPGLEAIRVDSFTLSEQDEVAVFMHNRFDILDRFSLVAGLRYNNLGFTQQADVHPSLLVGEDVRPQQPIPLIPKTTERFIEWSGGLKLRYYYSDDIMLYASLDRGFRPGGINFNAPASAATFDKETSDSLELGLKGEFYGGALRLLVAAFGQRYQDYQAALRNVVVPDPDFGDRNVRNLIDNADEARITGMEIEMTTVVPPWFLRASVSYNDTEFTDYEDAPCTIDGDHGRCDLTDEAINELPLWNTHLTLEYAVPWLGEEFYARLLGNYRSSNRTDEGNDLEDFAVVDGFLGWRSHAGSWDLGLWARNVFDEDGQFSRENLARPGLFTGELTRPRHYGLSLRYRY